MARVKKTTRKPAEVAADRIESPHSGKKTRQIGDQREVERHDLSGEAGARSGSVRQVGPSDIRDSGTPGKNAVKRVGEANWEDEVAANQRLSPDRRQEGSVKQVGPTDADYDTLTRRNGPTLQPKTSRPLRTRTIIHASRLLKSGVGSVHPWSRFAGQPGTVRGNSNVRVAGAAKESVLVNGRPRAFGPEPIEDDPVTPTGDAIVPGSTGDYAPQIGGEQATSITDTAADLEANINPNGSPTTYYFEYGEDTNYGTSAPVSEDGDAGTGHIISPVSESLTGLIAATLYHYRLVAENQYGSTVGGDQTFTTAVTP